MSDASDEIEGTDLQHDQAEFKREAAARAGYILWRMGDLPAVYTDIMPYSVMATELYDAERAIRRQYREDQKLAPSPWKSVGPRCCLLDFTGMNAADRMAFGIDVQIGVGMPDAIKEGCDDHPDVLAAWERARELPIYQLHAERADLIEKLDASSAYRFKPGEQDQMTARLGTIDVEIRHLKGAD